MLKRCPFCAEEIQDEATVCHFCGRNLAAYRSPEERRNRTIGGLIAVGVLVLMGVIIKVGERSQDQQYPRASVQIGDEVRLVVSSGSVVVCLDEAAYEEFTKLAVANDTLGLAEQTLHGRSFLVDSGTRAQLIESGFSRCRVRILEGKHFGRSGWVPPSLVVK